MVIPYEVSALLTSSRQVGKTIVLATGVFDLLHEEHKNFLKNAKEFGDVLIVGVETDSRVREIKGGGRPVQPQDVRVQQVQDLEFVDRAFLLPTSFSTQEEYDMFMKLVHPDIYAVSSHTEYLDNKRALTEKYGGRVAVVHQHNPDISTTAILQKTQTTQTSTQTNTY